jgi:hypothetical protein
MSKEFDVVIHGATGFTGRLVAEYMMARYPNGSNAEGIRWAMGVAVQKNSPLCAMKSVRQKTRPSSSQTPPMP